MANICCIRAPPNTFAKSLAVRISKDFEVISLSRIDHTRPILKMIDNLRRLQAAAISVSKPPGSIEPPRSITSKKNLYREHVHQCALKIIKHMGRHCDVRLAAKFLSELPDQTTRDAVEIWFCSFGCVSGTHDNQILRFVRGKPTRLRAAIDKPYWKFISRKRR